LSYGTTASWAQRLQNGAAAGDDRRRRAALACAALSLLGGLVYLNALHNPFVYDDFHMVVDNPTLPHPFDLRRLVLYQVTRPVVNFSYAIDRAVWGPGPFGFHLTNVLLHTANVALLFVLARLLARDRVRRKRANAPNPDVVAGIAAALFAVHPMMTEAVGYISGRTEVLCATFFLAAFLYARAWMIRGRREWWILGIACWVASIATKEIGAVFPFVLLAYDRILGEGTPDERRMRLFRLHVPLIAVTIVATIVRLGVVALVEHPGTTIVHWKYGLVELEVVWRYLLLYMTPGSQSIFHEVAPIRSVFELRALFAIAVFGVLVACAWRERKAVGLISLGITWFLLLLVPSAALVMLDLGEPMVEHRVYLASCGLFLAAGSATGRLWAMFVTPRARRRAVVLAAAGLFALCGATVVRNAVWGRPVTLWMEAVQRAPDHWRARLMLGEALQNDGRCADAVVQYRTAIALRPREQFGYMKMGLCLAEMGRLEEASAAFRQLQRLDPASTVASIGLGDVALLAGNSDRARQYFLECLEREPRNVAARQSLAMLEETIVGNPAGALRWCEEIRQLAPETPGNDECIRRNRSRADASGSR
jgi:Flp pilus assembly protein TadD